MATLIPRSSPLVQQCCKNASTSSPSLTSPLNQESRRLQSTYRRQVIRNHVPPAPGFLPKRQDTGGRSSQSQSHVVFNPPASAPNVYHTPMKFLPQADRRRQLYESAQQSLYAHQPSRTQPSPITKPGTHLHEQTTTLPSSMTPQLPLNNKNLPSLVGTPTPKKYHLGEAEIAEIRRLRQEDPFKWTRLALAEKFNCSQFFVSLVQKSPVAAAKHARDLVDAKKQWGQRKTMAREDRSRRKALWGRDA